MIRLLPVALLFAACEPAVAQQRDGGQALQQLMQSDANNDGQVTRAEFAAQRGKQFARLDRTGDGYVVASEIPRRARNRLPDGMSADQMLSRLDADNDGKVSQAEFVNGPAPVFDRVDADRNGVATQAELDAARAALAARQ